MTVSSLDDVRLVQLQARGNEQGMLVVSQCRQEIPFAVDRMFTVSAPAGAVRGHHAHRKQQQFLVCVAGAIEVTVDDGTARRAFVLDSPCVGLYLPAGIWAEQTYGAAGSVLVVLCDAPYDEGDYFRDFEQFLRFKTGSVSAEKNAPDGEV